MALICIDFDYTVANGHTHNSIWEAIDEKPSIEKDQEAHWDVIKGIPPVGKAATWAAMLEILVRDGHSIAITSFNDFPHVIPRYLKEVLKLSDDVLKKINVVAYLPDDQSHKNDHIARAIKEAKLDGIDKNQVILVDDSDRNVKAAKRAGYTSILALPELGNHIPQMLVAAVHADYISGKIYEGPKSKGLFSKETKEPETYKETTQHKAEQKLS